MNAIRHPGEQLYTLADVQAALTTADEVRDPCARKTTDGHAHARRVAAQARLARGQWADAGNGLQVRLT